MKDLRQVQSIGYRELLRSRVRQLRHDIISTQRDAFTTARAERAADVASRHDQVREMIDIEFRQARLDQAAIDRAARKHCVTTRHHDVQQELATHRHTRITEGQHEHEQRMRQGRERKRLVQDQANTLHAEIAADESQRLAAARTLHIDRMTEHVARMRYVHEHGIQTHQLLHRHNLQTAQMCRRSRDEREATLNSVYGWVEEFTGRSLR